MKNPNMKRLEGTVLALFLLLSAAGCGGGSAGTPVQEPVQTPVQTIQQEPVQEPVQAIQQEPVQEPVQDIQPEPAQEPVRNVETEVTGSAGTSSAIERIERAKAYRDEKAAEIDVANAEVKDAENDMDSVKAVARIKNLYCVAKKASSYDYVDVTDEHNPYDLVWVYGDRKTEGDDGFGDLYASYVAACDWSLVFDVEYYKAAFPMLTIQYHENDELLLEHFQTIGVHEGRQGCENFNVSAYMAHCGKSLFEAFGNDSACYYFYYMLNHDAEKSVDTSDPNGEYPLWRTLELTKAQQDELDAVNEYREEVGSDPVEMDPELVALANYRAWANAEYGYHGHDWIDDNWNECQQIMKKLGVHSWSENTTAYYDNVSKNMTMGIYAHNYRYSKSHYDAMVAAKHAWLGVSHTYRNLETKDYLGAFDVFTEDMPKTSTAR